MKRSTDRILTNQVGSLARPKDLLEMMDAKLKGKPYDSESYNKRVHSAVAEVVRKQVECAVDIVTDGEQGKASFNAYVVERLTGFAPVASSEERIAARMKLNEAQAFPEYYEKYFADHMCGVGPNQQVVCTGRIAYKGQEAVRTDIENLKAALQGVWLPKRCLCLPLLRVSGATTTIVRTRSFSMLWPKRCGRSISRLWMQVSFSK